MRTIALTALLSLTALLGCRDSTAPIRDSNAAPIDFMSPIALRTSVSSPVLTPGNSVMVTVTVTNTSNATVNVNAGDCPWRYVIETVDGHALNRGNPICSSALLVHVLGPGESVTFSTPWDGIVLVGEDVVGRVPAGDYLLRGSTTNGAVRSNPAVKLTVLP
jgi:hypothetical protein